ncbi:MAG TPA: nucleotidyltransferase domain-containing protein [Methylomirabilota bacterium]|nr:nucleotidyltransferase domain-containing protein [Methylomirabilota bacterium]
MTPQRPDNRPDPEVLSVARRVAAIVREVTGDPAYRTFLFGSWASGEARERSDIDIGIEGPTEVRPATMAEIREACDALPTLFTVDLVDFARAPRDFAANAISRSLEVEPA